MQKEYTLMGIQPDAKINSKSYSYSPIILEYKQKDSKYDDSLTVFVQLHDNSEYSTITYIGGCFDNNCGIVLRVELADMESEELKSGNGVVDPEKVLEKLQKMAQCFYNTFNS